MDSIGHPIYASFAQDARILDSRERQLRPYGSAAKSRWPSSFAFSRGTEGGWITLAEILKSPVSQKSIMEHLESRASVFLRAATAGPGAPDDRCTRYALAVSSTLARDLPICWCSAKAPLEPDKEDRGSPVINFPARRLGREEAMVFNI